MYLDTMQQVLSNTSKVLVDTKGQGNLLYLPLDKLMQAARRGRLRRPPLPAQARLAGRPTDAGGPTPRCRHRWSRRTEESRETFARAGER
jgi:membrane protease subunit HflK